MIRRGFGDIYATPDGMFVDWYGCMSRSTLDEDWGGDEVFAYFAALDGAGGLLTDYIRSANVHRSF